MLKLLSSIFAILIITTLVVWLSLYIKKYGFDLDLLKALPAEAKRLIAEAKGN